MADKGIAHRTVSVVFLVVRPVWRHLKEPGRAPQIQCRAALPNINAFIITNSELLTRHTAPPERSPRRQFHKFSDPRIASSRQTLASPPAMHRRIAPL